MPAIPASEPARTAWPPGRVLRVGVGLVAVTVALWMFIFPAFFPMTTDALVNVRVVTIRAPLDGYLGPSAVEDGDLVRAGDPLVTVTDDGVDPSTEAEVSSPIDGTVLRREVAAGEFVEAGRDLLVIEDPSTVVVEAWFPQRDLSEVRPGDRALVRLVGSRGQLQGTVKAVRFDPDPSFAYSLPHPDRKSFRAVIQLDGQPRHPPVAGQRARALLVGEGAGLFKRALVRLYTLADL